MSQDDREGPSPNEIEEKVGYKSPPRKTRFKPGQSGNPKGRPRGSRNFSSLIERELKQKLVVTENGVRKTITKREAVAKQLVNKAVTGDPKATATLLVEDRLLSDVEIHGAPRGHDEAEADEQVVKTFLSRLREAQVPSHEIASGGDRAGPDQKAAGATDEPDAPS